MMVQRHSEYARIEGDTYVTPQWVWDCIHHVQPWTVQAVDPAPPYVTYDFLSDWSEFPRGIATNPPFKLSDRFVRHALDVRPICNIAMLLPHNWDSAKSRIDLFRDRRFVGKYILTERIRWANLVQKKNGPSTNHAWYVWLEEGRGYMKPFLEWL